MSEQVPYPSPSFESVGFADNPEPRCPCLLLLDTSGSMQGEAIAQLNAGTDGEPTDDWKPAAAEVHAGEDRKSFAFFAVGVENANMETLAQIATREPLRLRGLQFRSLFQWLSSSMRAVSQSTPGDVVPIVNPATPEGWAAV